MSKKSKKFPTPVMTKLHRHSAGNQDEPFLCNYQNAGNTVPWPDKKDRLYFCHKMLTRKEVAALVKELKRVERIMK